MLSAQLEPLRNQVAAVRRTTPTISPREGSEAREPVGAPSAIGRRLEEAIEYSGRTERTTITAGAERYGAVRIVEEQEKAKVEAENDREGLTIFADRSRFETGAAGYGVVCSCGDRWVRVKAQMDYNQEAFDAECVALARALEVTARRQTPPQAVTIFANAQVVIRRMASGRNRGQRSNKGQGVKDCSQNRMHLLWVWCRSSTAPSEQSRCPGILDWRG